MVHRVGERGGKKREESLLVPNEIMREVGVGWGSEGIQVCKHWGQSTGTSEERTIPKRKRQALVDQLIQKPTNKICLPCRDGKGKKQEND